MNAPNMAPLLSILLPAYCYPEGVQRILHALDAPGLEAQVEVLVADDSPDDAVHRLVQSLAPRVSLPVIYRHNVPALGAAANWNTLLDQARGNHVWLLHHDEFPLGRDFLPRLLKELHRDAAADVLLLDCLLVDPTSGRNRQHLPMALRAFVARHAPGYLLRRNAIGPTACLVIRRERYPRFDPRLHWLVDVDVYARLLYSGVRLRACPTLKVGSMLGRHDSITARIGSGLDQLHRNELDLLMASRGRTAPAPWLRLAGGQTLDACVMRGAETLAWAALRGATRALAELGLGAMPRVQVRQALGES